MGGAGDVADPTGTHIKLSSSGHTTMVGPRAALRYLHPFSLPPALTVSRGETHLL